MAKLGIFLCIAILLAASITALGIAPSRDMMNYDSQAHTMTVRIINNDHKDMKVLLYAQGELASYTTLPITSIDVRSTDEEKSFTYTIQLPAGLEPGIKDLDIVALEVPADMKVPESSQTQILSTITVIYQLKVNIPYPGTYADGVLYISEGNANETTTFNANIVNRGTQAIDKVEGELVIKGPTNEEIKRIKATSLTNLASQTSQKMQVDWLSDVNPGVYYAEYIVSYGSKQFVLRKTFMVGDYSIEIRNIAVQDFKIGAVAKFNMEVVNKWNQPVDNVYAELQIMDDKGNTVSNTKTITTTVSPLTTSVIYAYWDTQGITVGNYDVHTILHYGDKTTERIYKALVGIDSITVNNAEGTTGNVIGANTKGNSTSVLTILVIILVVVNVGWLVYFKFLKKKKEQ